MGDLMAERSLDGGVTSRSARKTASPMALFFREFLRHPAMIGSIIPSSRRTIEAMLSDVRWEETRLFVEYGPGVGTFCDTILERLAPEATLLVIDTNPAFIDYLRRRYTDSRFIAVHGSAADVGDIITAHGFDSADYVLSGLPFSTLPAGVGARIAEQTFEALSPGGSFLIYQYSPYALRLLAPHFPRVDRAFEWLNIPPCHILKARKPLET